VSTSLAVHCGRVADTRAKLVGGFGVNEESKYGSTEVFVTGRVSPVLRGVT
jgi:hypothetical protein